MASAGILFMEPYINLATGSMSMLGSQVQTSFTPSKIESIQEKKLILNKIDAIHYNIQKIRGIIIQSFTEYEYLLGPNLNTYKATVERLITKLEKDAEATETNPEPQPENPATDVSPNTGNPTNTEEKPIAPDETGKSIADAYIKLISAVKNLSSSGIFGKGKKAAEKEEKVEFTEVTKIVSNIDKKSLSKSEEKMTVLCNILHMCDEIIFTYNKDFPTPPTIDTPVDVKEVYKKMMKSASFLKKIVNENKSLLTGSSSVMSGGYMRDYMRGGRGLSGYEVEITPDGEKFIKYSVILYLNKYPNSTTYECRWFIDRLFLRMYLEKTAELNTLFPGIDNGLKKSQEEANDETETIIHSLPPLTEHPENTQKVEQKKETIEKLEELASNHLENIRKSNNPSYQQSQRKSLLFIQEKIKELKHEVNDLIPDTFEDKIVFDPAKRNEIASIPSRPNQPSPQNTLGSPILQPNADTLLPPLGSVQDRLEKLHSTKDYNNRKLKDAKDILKYYEDQLKRVISNLKTTSPEHKEHYQREEERTERQIELQNKQIIDINDRITKNDKEIADLEPPEHEVQPSAILKIV